MTTSRQPTPGDSGRTAGDAPPSDPRTAPPVAGAFTGFPAVREKSSTLVSVLDAKERTEGWSPNQEPTWRRKVKLPRIGESGFLGQQMMDENGIPAGDPRPPQPEQQL
jgi:hypothetical protein